MNALNDTNHKGPLAQFGGALFGDKGESVGEGLDTFLSIRGWFKSGKGFLDGMIEGDVDPEDIHGVSSGLKKYYDLHQANQCRSL